VAFGKLSRPSTGTEEADAAYRDYIKEARGKLIVADFEWKTLKLEKKKALETTKRTLEKRKKQAQKMSEGNQNSKAQKSARLKEIDKELQRIEKDMENIPAQIKSLEDEMHEPYELTVKEIKKIATTRK
jgi:chromosome segregation ATPase